MAKNIIHLETKLQESQINKVNNEAEQEELSSNTIKQNNKIIEESKDLEAHNDIIEKEVVSIQRRKRTKHLKTIFSAKSLLTHARKK